jgi:hypothetical protein
MAWQSSALGSNVVSSYLHIDNLRADLLAGKFWDSVGVTKYCQIAHNNTDGIVNASAGKLLLQLAGVTHASFGPSDCIIGLGNVYTNAAQKFVTPDAGATKYAEFYHNGTRAIFSSYGAGSGSTQVGGLVDNYAYIGSGSGVSRLYMWDVGAGAWKYAYINNGAWVIA